jgi:uncharacterized protein
MNETTVIQENNASSENSPLPKTINWKQTGGFLGLTFGLTWLLDLVLYLKGGLNNPAVGMDLQFQMLIPAASAIILGMFFYKDSPLYYKTNRTVSRWFFYYYLLAAAIYLAAVIACFINPAIYAPISSFLLLLSVVGLILLVILRVVGKEKAFSPVNLMGGKAIYWVIFGVGFVLFYTIQTLLNMAFKLGAPVDLQALMPQLKLGTLPNSVILINAGINAVLLGPFLGMFITFGEEYGWRGTLQPALIKLGKIKGVLLLGIIWGIWHWPVILMGYNYPGQPILGSLMMVLFTIALAFILAYAVFKSHGVWIAAFLHAVNNQTLSYLQGFIYAPKNLMLSFGIGLFGLVCFAIVVFFILRDPIWKE